MMRRLPWLLAVLLAGCAVVNMPDTLRARLASEWHVFHTAEGLWKIRADGSERVHVLGVEGEGDTVSIGLWPALHPSGETIAFAWAEGVPRERLGRDVFSATRLSLREVWDGGSRELSVARSPIPMFADSAAFADSDPKTWRFRSDQLVGLAYGPDGRLACIERTLLMGDLVLVVAPDAGRRVEEYPLGVQEARLSAWRGLTFAPDGKSLLIPRADGWILQQQLVAPRLTNRLAYGLEAASSPAGALALIGVPSDSLQGVPHGGAIEVVPTSGDRSLHFRAVIRESLGISNLRWTADERCLLFESHFAHSIMQGYRSRQLYVLDLAEGQHYYVEELE